MEGEGALPFRTLLLVFVGLQLGMVMSTMDGTIVATALPSITRDLGGRDTITWVVTGANHGWTKTEVPIKTLDEVTGIEGISYQKKFLPGMDFLGVAFGTAASLTAASFFFRKPNKK